MLARSGPQTMPPVEKRGHRSPCARIIALLLSLAVVVPVSPCFARPQPAARGHNLVRVVARGMSASQEKPFVMGREGRR